MKKSLLFLTVIVSSALFTSSLKADDFFPQGDFSSGSVGALPENWTGHEQPHLDRVKGSHELVEEGDETFLRLEKQNEQSVLRVESTEEIPKGTKEVTLSVTDRVIDIIPGIENPNRYNFRVGVAFKDAENKTLKDGTPQISRNRSVPEWKTQTVTYEVPEGATSVTISLMMLECTGIWEVQTVELTAN